VAAVPREMPEIAFHTGLPDKIGYACRLLRKASRQGLRVRVIAEAAALDLLDTALWTFDPHDFVPHLRLGRGAAPAAAMHRTAVWLTPESARWPDGAEAPGVLVNLGLASTLDVDAYERVFELVSDDVNERAAGRRRWRQYEAAGFTIRHFLAAEDGTAD
jgi:DNA polymerase-3 subunit chi